MDPVERLRALASEAAIRSVPKLLKTALGEGIQATRKQAEEALKERVPAQMLHPPPRSSGKVAAGVLRAGMRATSSILARIRPTQATFSY